MEYYIGIDPGKGGGLVRLTGEGKVMVDKMPVTERDIWDWLMCQQGISSQDNFYAVIEKVHAMPGYGPVCPACKRQRNQGVASTFKFGVGYGGLRMALIGIGIPFEEVTPQRWQNELAIPPKKKEESKTEFKNRLKALAQQLFPGEKVTLATADALLIAEYCRQKHCGRKPCGSRRLRL